MDGLEVETLRRQILDTVVEFLIDRIRRDEYPSSTMMDAVERNISEETLREYAAVLFEKLSRDQYPSMDMLRRLVLLVA